MAINSFKGEYAFLSNFWPWEGPRLVGPPAPILWKGVSYPSAEHLYQCAKATTDFDRQRIITAETPGLAKKIGREIKRRDDWTDDFAREVMLKVEEAKYLQHDDLAERLLATEEEQLIEGNYWGDVTWGVDLRTGRGENWLGRLIMIVRAELRFKKELQQIVNEMRMGMRVDCVFKREAA